MSLRLSESPFFSYLREERQFSFLLAHLVMTRGAALGAFIDLLNEAAGQQVWDPGGALDEAEVYVEFAILRDQWFALGPGDRRTAVLAATVAEANARKRRYVDDLLRSVPSLVPLADAVKPEAPAAFNAFFMGERGLRIVRDIASPGLWPVAGLADRFGSHPEVFFDLCRVKWAFHIKPDIVLMRTGLPPICVEAKLESGEGRYPAGKDARTVDRVMGSEKRESQFRLQQFLFGQLFGEPCVPVVIQKWPASFASGAPVLSWGQVFNRLFSAQAPSQSIPFVERLMRSNAAIVQSYGDQVPPVHGVA